MGGPACTDLQVAHSDPLSSEDQGEFVEHVICSITGAADHELPAEELCSRMESAAQDFDRRTAQAFCDTLLDQLGDDPGNVRLLEALLILGLAHPETLERARVSLAVEGRRLAVLLERSGDVERARAVLEFLSSHMPREATVDQELAGLLRRSGNTDQLIERYMKRAELAVEQGKVGEAIPWLQEILLLDRSRRDVARMIRDLRYSEVDRADKRRGLVRAVIGLSAATALTTAGVVWELDARQRYQSLPPVQVHDAPSLESRLQALDHLQESSPWWHSKGPLEQERAGIQQSLDSLKAAEREAALGAKQVRQESLDRAESLRLEGLKHVDNGQFEAALQAFDLALGEAPDDWAHRMQVETDRTALATYLEEQR